MQIQNPKATIRGTKELHARATGCQLLPLWQHMHFLK